MSKADKKITLVSPLRGVLVPIEKVPDPVFAEKMVGDGVSIDPLDGVLYAPCDGKVAHLHPSGHAVTIKTTDNLEILLHIGLETVALKGEGFTPKVSSGNTVKAGDVLIKFDMALVASKAPYLLTQIIVTTMDTVSSITPNDEGPVSVGDPIFTVSYSDRQEPTTAQNSDNTKRVVSEEIVIPNDIGIHARPAAVLVKLSKRFDSAIEIVLGNSTANAKSITSIMKLNTTHGDKVVVIATGSDAEVAIATITPEIQAGLGDEAVSLIAATAPAKELPKIIAEEVPGELSGIAASPGLATGIIFQLTEEIHTIVEIAEDQASEQKRINDAITQAATDLQGLRDKLSHDGEPAKAAVFEAHTELLEDPDLQALVVTFLSQGKSAEFSWKSGYEQQAQELRALNNSVLAARANDIRDVGSRVLNILLCKETKPRSFPKGTILIAKDLTPSITANLDASIVKGFCTVLGGATSHAAILARALGIPAVTGINQEVLNLENGQMVIINGGKGILKTEPDTEYIKKIEEIQAKVFARNTAELSVAKSPAQTTDGHTIEIVGNVGNPKNAEKIVGLGGEGIGLLRSEIIFQDRATAPTEDEQYQVYKKVAKAVGPDNKVVIRTLDVGGDKPLPYLPLPQEENPFLGERGIRVSLNQPEILRTQLRALLRASAHGNIHIMFPMIGILEEWREAKAILEEERAKLGVDPVPTGIMIEVPSAALLAEQFALEVDFFSIGTNDLTQYTMAIDRRHPKLGPQADSLHPAVLKLIKITVEAAQKYGKWVGVCGGLGGDPQAIPILLGLGIDELSISIPSIPSVKAQIRTLSQKGCEILAAKALTVGTAQEMRELSPNPYAEEQLLDE